jgi:tetratricopeptide (TPR) repeat protein
MMVPVMQLSKSVQLLVRGLLLLLIIALGSNYLIRFALRPRPASPKPANVDAEGPPPNEAAFRSALDAGNQAFRDGRYTDALDRFQEAEKSGPQLTDQQYESLKKSRLQLAQVYEGGGDNAAAQRVYHVVTDCALQQGYAQSRAKQWERALARAQDSEDLSAHLTEGRRGALQYATGLSASSLIELQRYPEAAQAQQRMIDYLKSTVDGDDWAFGSNYESLAETYSKAQDWPEFEQTLLLAIAACDRTLANPPAENGPTISDATRRTKNVAQYNLVISYYREGNTETALSKADDYFAAYPEAPPDPMHPLTVQFHSRDFASLAVTIASEAKRQDQIDLWRQRGGVVQGNFYVIALHP